MPSAYVGSRSEAIAAAEASFSSGPKDFGLRVQGVPKSDLGLSVIKDLIGGAPFGRRRSTHSSSVSAQAPDREVNPPKAGMTLKPTTHLNCGAARAQRPACQARSLMRARPMAVTRLAVVRSLATLSLEKPLKGRVQLVL